MATRVRWTVQILGVLAVVSCDLNPNVSVMKEQDAGAPPGCRSSADCEGVCDMLLRECVKASEAKCFGSDATCDRYDGLPLCESGACSPARCQEDLDCGEPGYVSCNAGRCKDRNLGCVGEADDRPATSEEGTYRVQVQNLLLGDVPRDLKVKLCGSARDHACETPPLSATVRLDAEQGLIVIEHLPPQTPIHLQLHAANFFDTEFYSQRVVVGDTDEPVAIKLFPRSPSLVGILAEAAGEEADVDHKATFMGRFFDCNDEPKAGVSPSAAGYGWYYILGEEVPSTAFYIDATGEPLPGVTASNEDGAGGIVNLLGNVGIILTASHGSSLVSSLVVWPKPGWITYAHFYPRDYTR